MWFFRLYVVYIKLSDFIFVLLFGIGYSEWNDELFLFFICYMDVEVWIVKGGIWKIEFKREKGFDIFLIVFMVIGEYFFCIIYFFFFVSFIVMIVGRWVFLFFFDSEW